MAAARPFMLLTGALLAVAAGLAGLLRSAGLEAAREVPAEIYWVVLFVFLVAGVVMLIFAPPSRKSERRVDLQAPVTRDHVAHPSTGSELSRTSLPVTRTSPMPRKRSSYRARGPGDRGDGQSVGGSGSIDDNEHKMRESSKRESGTDPSRKEQPVAQASEHGGGSTEATGGQKGPAASRQGDDNLKPIVRGNEDWLHRVPSSTPAGEEGMQYAGGVDDPAGSPFEGAIGDTPKDNGNQNPSLSFEEQRHLREERRRVELEARLEDLQQRLNQAKVSLGLGRISHVGYRQYIKEVERERMLIEGELMALQDDV